MRRSLAAIAGTIAGLIALLSFKSGSSRRVPGLVARSSATTTPTTAPTSPGADQPVDAPTTTTAPPKKTATGPQVDNRYGPVQVQVTVQGSTILDVEAVQLPTDRRRSQEISDQAAPILRQEALAAQSARIDVVSGATYTSQGYTQSLQAALDAARQ
jgi:uncharacterized protein with FMN-binding domain